MKLHELAVDHGHKSFLITKHRKQIKQHEHNETHMKQEDQNKQTNKQKRDLY